MSAENKEIMEQKLHDIFDYLCSNQTNDNTLISGTAGEILFMVYYSRYFQNQKAIETASNKIDQLFDIISKGDGNPTFANGICGYAWLLEHLVQNNFIEYDLDDLYQNTDEELNQWMCHFIKNKNYDYLHGSVGIANYFLNRNTEKSNTFLKHFIDLLSNISIREGETAIKFESIIYNTGNPFWVFNLGLAHGMTSLIYFFQRCLHHENFKDCPKVKKLFSGINNYYKQNVNDININKSFFPSWVGTNINKDSRLAWCYGDMGIGITYLNAGYNLNDLEFTQFGTQVLLNTLKRKEIIEENIFDGGICHGSAGLAIIYNYAYQITTHKDFQIASDYWLEVTQNQAIHPDGICGYKSFAGEKEYKYYNQSGLLEGVAGIGLVFLSKLNPAIKGWEKTLMIS